jgi:hypothetical protein
VPSGEVAGVAALHFAGVAGLRVQCKCPARQWLPPWLRVRPSLGRSCSPGQPVELLQLPFPDPSRLHFVLVNPMCVAWGRARQLCSTACAEARM